ncbi:MAG: hypothetical protein EA392_05675 [Cryomorphaceae bacterium]|nr:MAG: hypothetical protein EA392_05675 [Cryomorphaceae bacterium]
MYTPKSISFCLFIISLTLAFAPSAQAQSIVINEMMSSNATTIADMDGDYEDWFELYNDGQDTVNLDGFRVSDDIEELDKWIFPERLLAPGEFLLIFASGKDRQETELHTNFGVNISGELLILSNAEGVVIDILPPYEMITDQSVGRLPDGDENLVMFGVSTPGFSNLSGELAPDLSDEISFSHPSGLYPAPFELHLNNLDGNHNIHYTLNGSDPTPEDPVWPGFMLIDDRTSEPNSISTIPTNTPETYVSLGWQPPIGQVFKGTVLKARVFSGSEPKSVVYAKSYFVNDSILERYPNLPVISIATDSMHLFDYETGLLVPGITHDENPDLPIEWGYGNYNNSGMDWERPAHVTLLEPDGSVGMEQQVGLRIHGGGSRQFPIKSFRLYARNLYGNNELDYDFFPWRPVSHYRRIILRNSGNDFNTTYCTDALSALMIENCNIARQEYRPSVLFVNGEFWGIMNMRDYMDENYFEAVESVDPDDLTIVDNWYAQVHGSNTAFLNLMDYVADHNPAYPEHYQYIIDKIDLDNYLDYVTMRIYTAVTDWPGNNIRVWNNTADDNLFRWAFRDNDRAMREPHFNAFVHATQESNLYWHHSELSIRLFKKLLQNNVFKEAFYQRFIQRVLNDFQPEVVHPMIDSIAGLIGPVMDEHVKRWQFPASQQVWLQEMDKLRHFVDERPCASLLQLVNFLDIQPAYYPLGVCDSLDMLANTYFAGSTQIQMSIWPVPATDVINVSLDEYPGGNLKMGIADVTGRFVLPMEEVNISMFATAQFLTRGLSSGTYVLIAESQHTRSSKAFVVGARY